MIPLQIHLKDPLEGLTSGQRDAFAKVKSGLNVFVTGPGGCGKSYLINEIKKDFERNGKCVAVTALTGKAAVLIGGRTIHSWASIGIGNKTVDEYYRMIRRNITLLKQWFETDLLIIDEVSMMSAELWNKLVHLARLVTKFGGKFGKLQLMLSGDFCQLPPVGDDRFCFQSSLFDEVIDEIVSMDEMVRQTDEDFISMLSEVRLGRCPEWVEERLMSRLITEEKYAELMGSTGDLSIKPTVLYPLKRDVAAENENELLKLNEHIFEYECIDKAYPMVGTGKDRKRSFMEQRISGRDVDVVNKMFDSRNVPIKLQLALGAQVMYTKNVRDTSIVNGSKGVVIEFDEKNYPIVKFDEESGGVEMTVVSEVFETETGRMMYTRTQLPLILCWALTCHKAQGCTLTKMITDLGSSFCSGQVYTTISRVKTLDGLFLLGFDPSKIRCDPDVVQWYIDLAHEKTP